MDWSRLATAVDTLVILMGLENLPHITRSLIEAGRAAETPVALVERGTTSAQRVVIGRLDSIAELAITAGVWPPAVIVVGEVVALRQRLLSAVEGSDQIGVGTGEQGVATEAELREEVLQMLLAAR